MKKLSRPKKILYLFLILLIFLIVTNPSILPLPASWREWLYNAWSRVFGSVDEITKSVTIDWISLFQIVAIVIVMTAYILHIPIGVASGGYIHLGDAFIFTAACMLPQPYALAVGAIGAGVADLLTAPIWAPALRTPGHSIWALRTRLTSATMPWRL